MERHTFSSLRQLADQQAAHHQREKLFAEGQLEKPWSAYGSSISNYEHIFADLFPGQEQPLMEFREARKRLGKPCIALDLMSEGSALHDLKPDRGLAVTLTHFPNQSAVEPNDNTVDVIAGNIFTQAIWRKVIQWIQHYDPNQPVFDLIMECGTDALAGFPDDPKLMQHLVSNLWSVLSSDDGLLVMELPTAARSYGATWANHLNQVVSRPFAQYSSFPKRYPILCLRKTVGDPKQLPSFVS